MPKPTVKARPIRTATSSVTSPAVKPPLNFRDGHGFVDGRWGSLRAALAGMAYTLRTQPNAWIELTALGVVGVAGWWLGITRLEWALLALTVTTVLALEAVNTAVEAVVDLMSPEYQPLAKIAKDAAAGALVFAVLGSIAVAGVVFGPRVWALVF